MMVFEDLGLLDEMTVQLIMQELEPDELLVAMAVADDNFREMVYENLSESEAGLLSDQLEILGVPSTSAVEAVESRIASIIRFS
jgi:flagellar motor switch protein FliG